MLRLLAMVSGVVVMFWNVENLFDPHNDKFKNDDDFTPRGKNSWSYRRFEVKCNSIAKIILSAGNEYGDFPAVIGLAEVENDYVLEQLTKKSPLFKLDYGYIHYESPDLRGIDVALLYRKGVFVPISSEAIQVLIPDGNPTRDILHVFGVLHETDSIHFFVNHWPSKLGGEETSQPRRLAAESALKSKLNELPEGAKIVLMGDFNQSNPFQDSSFVQYDVTEDGTIKFQGVWEQIDYFYTSHAISEQSLFLPFRPDIILEEDKTFLGLKPFRTYIGPRYNGGVSDHLPIILLLK